MWVVKLGGSLCTDPLLPDWLTLLSQLGGGRIAVVCGGGTLADEVRSLQSRWQVDDLSAHNMAVLAMVQNGFLLHGLDPALQALHREADILPTLRRGGVALWLPLERLREQADATTRWEHTSDSLALGLAQRLHAERLIVVKSCDIDPQLSLEQLGEIGVLDADFAPLARRAGLPIDVLSREQAGELRSLLLQGQRSGGVSLHLA